MLLEYKNNKKISKNKAAEIENLYAIKMIAGKN